MRRGPRHDDRAALWAASRDGVISAGELVALGVPESTVYRRCRAGGPWQLLFPGIVLLSNGEPTARQWELGALARGGPGAMLTGLVACRHHGLLRLPSITVVHVLVTIDRQVTSTGRALIERTRRLPRPRERDGLPVAPLPRAVLDAARRMRDPTQIAALLAEPVQRRLVLPETLRAELDTGCRKGSAAPRQVLIAVEDGIRSAAEFDAREFWRAAGLPDSVRWNVRIYDEHGVFIAMVDAFVEEVGFVWEIDSVEQHFATPDQVRETAQRRRLILGTGLYPATTRPSECRDHPDEVEQDLRNGLAIAAAMPAPKITFVVDGPRGRGSGSASER